MHILKHGVEKSPKNFEKPETHKHNRHDSKNMTFVQNGPSVNKDKVDHLCTKFEEFILIYEAMMAKNKCDLFSAVK